MPNIPIQQKGSFPYWLFLVVGLLVLGFILFWLIGFSGDHPHARPGMLIALDQLTTIAGNLIN